MERTYKMNLFKKIIEAYKLWKEITENSENER